MKTPRLLQNAFALVMLASLAGHAGAQEDHGALALDLVNEARLAEGLEPLAATEALAAAAQAHANDMLSRDYYAHVSPEGETVRDRFLEAGGGRWRLVSENIAMCEGCPTPPSPDRVREFEQGWMQSPEHRANILDPGLEQFGFALTSGENVTYAVQTFAGPGRAEGLPAGEVEEEAPPAALSERALGAVNRAREAEGLEPLSASGPLDRAAARLTRAGVVSEEQAAFTEAVEATDGTWSSIGLVSGECGGCGSVPTRMGATNFLEGWLDQPQLRQTLLDPQAESFGFALSASGEGRNGAVALIGHR